MFNHLLNGLNLLDNGSAITYLFAGSLAGVVLGVLPGGGGLVLLTVVLALAAHLSLTAIFCLFLGTNGGSYFSASIAAILLKTPQHPESYAVSLDGFPMAQRGEGARALGISASSTLLGGLVGVVIFLGFIQVMDSLPTLFHPPELVALIILTLIIVGTIDSKSVGKGLLAGAAGLMVASIGTDVITGVTRYAFGTVGLLDGVALVPIFFGVFMLPQVIMMFGSGTSVVSEGRSDLQAVTPTLGTGFARQVLVGIADTIRYWRVSVLSGVVGAVLGVIPGMGGFTANFMTYQIAQQTSRRRELFGTGIPEGIIAPEGSSLAKEAGHLVPLLGLGIPGGVGGAIFLAILSLKGIRVGYAFNKFYPNLTYEMFWIMLFTVIIGTVVGLLCAPFLARVTRVPGASLLPIIIALAALGPFIEEDSFFAVVEVLIFAFIGLSFRKLGYPVAAFVIAVILGPILEQNIYLTHELYSGWAFIPARPIADTIFVIAIGLIGLKWYQARKDRRSLRALSAGLVDGITSMKEIARAKVNENYNSLELVTSLFTFAISLPYAIYGAVEYPFVSAILPVVAACLVSLLSLMQLQRTVRLHMSRDRSSPSVVASQLAVSKPDEVFSAAPNAAQSVLDAPLFGRGAVALDLANDLAVASLVDEATQERGVNVRAASQIQPFSWGRRGQYTRELIALGWLGAVILLCYLFGFVVALPLFCGVFALSSGRQFLPRLRSQVIFGALTGLAMWAFAFESMSLVHIPFTPLL